MALKTITLNSPQEWDVVLRSLASWSGLQARAKNSADANSTIDIYNQIGAAIRSDSFTPLRPYDLSGVQANAGR